MVVNNVTGIFWVINGTNIPLNSLKYRRKESKITMLLEIVFLDQTLVSTRSCAKQSFFFQVTYASPFFDGTFSLMSCVMLVAV